MLLGLLLGLAATQAVPPPADSAVPRPWIASAAIGFEDFARDRATWTHQQVAIGHRWEAATIIGEVIRTTRFNRTDMAGAATTYARLGRGTSLYARLQVAPRSDVIARVDAAAEIERAVGGGWTAAGGYRRMSFADADVDIVGMAVSRYQGDWLFQGRSQVVIGSGRTGLGGRVMARRYLRGDPDRMIELGVGAGQEVVLLGSAEPAAIRGTRSVAGRARWRIGSARWGLETVATWNGEDGIPNRAGLTAGIFASW